MHMTNDTLRNISRNSANRGWHNLAKWAEEALKKAEADKS